MNLSKLDDPSHTFVIAEAGSNWKVGNSDENWKMIENLVKTASNAGADAIKFQTFNSKTLYASDAGQIKYIKDSGKSEKINSLIENLEMPLEYLQTINKICQKNNILFMSSAFSVKDLEEVDKFSIIHKVASYEINHVKLLESLAKTKKPILLSTGSCSNEEIDFAIKFLNDRSHNDIALLQCTSKYPAPLETMNLSVIPNLKRKYGLPIGLSDHSMDPIIAPLVAIGFGATIIEKHFTLNRSLPGPDQSFAIEPNELELMISSIRKADRTKGTGEKIVLDVEKELKQFATRAIQAKKNISKGEIFNDDNIALLRPGERKRGAEARYYYTILGRKSLKNISEGDGIILEDCEN